MKTRPQKEHQWLHQLVGEWTYEAHSEMGPDKASVKTDGTESVRLLGEGLWILAEGHGEMPGGGPATSVMTLGYDPDKNRYVGTWIGSMMTHLWVYEGTLDASETELELATVGPSMTGDDKMIKYKDVIQLVDDDNRVLRSSVWVGTWQEIMVATYRRKA